jgi:hypothetical protein
MKKVLFFIAGRVPTGSETTALNALLAETEQVNVQVRTASEQATYGSNLEQADYVAGASVPSAYSSVPVYKSGATLPSTQAVVSNGVALTIPVTGTYATKATPTVVNGVVTGIVLS